MRFFLAVLILGTFPACTLRISPVTPSLLPVPTLALLIPTAGSEWTTVAPGLELRTFDPVPDNPVTRLTALRVDPSSFTFRVHYRPGSPLSTARWSSELPGAVVVVNANFFDTEGNALGLVVADGAATGSAFADRGGTFLVQNGVPRVRSSIREPYAGEALEQAVQGFPMLVLDGATAFTDTAPDRFTRRTVIAQDSAGRILLLATPLLGLPLRELSAFLPTTDAGIMTAFNLDGGGSTLMLLNGEALVTSLDSVPAVLSVYPRG